MSYFSGQFEMTCAKYFFLLIVMFDGNPEVITMIGCVTSNRLCESPPPGKCKHNELVVFDC